MPRHADDRTPTENTMLEANIRTQLKGYLERLEQPIELVASLDGGEKSIELRDLLREIAELSNKVTVREDGTDARKPSFSVGLANNGDQAARVRFAGIPMGHEFTSLILALLQVSGYPPKVDAAVIEQIRNISVKGTFRFETYISLSCHNCPDVVQALNLMAVLNPAIDSTMIDGALFQAEVDEKKIMAVPTVFMNGETFGSGRMTIEEIVAKFISLVDTGAAAREAEKLDAKAPYDVLVVGGGPVRPPPSTPRARAFAPAWWPSVSAARCWTPWASRTSSRCHTPTAPGWPWRWKKTSRPTRSTS
jgi:alkyl hydroperoxide reductase subunit F